jgi:hypothetical protein
MATGGADLSGRVWPTLFRPSRYLVAAGSRHGPFPSTRFRTAGPDLGERWPSRLVAAAEEHPRAIDVSAHPKRVYTSRGSSYANTKEAWRAFLARLLGASLLAVIWSNAFADNLVVNGGFETGDLTGWTGFSVTVAQAGEIAGLDHPQVLISPKHKTQLVYLICMFCSRSLPTFQESRMSSA